PQRAGFYVGLDLFRQPTRLVHINVQVTTMRAINFSEARSNLKAVFDRVIDDADVTIITRRDAEDVVVMSLTEWNSWKETEYLLASPANARHLLQAIADLDAGKGEHHALIVPEAVSTTVHEEHASYTTSKQRRSPRNTHKPAKPK
ncbi:MAG: type II toxin-antitoxin system prevent-host-death family antitoxin, partial [Xanthomonadales bacterium]|nr:type II toxin-antitoxin system prevent-host-death family antitoxin [Xanthomonadales bacterium]